MRIGYGYDSHEFRAGIPLKVGGVQIPHDKGLLGHSDGDVLLHAITDALLGALAQGDIGSFFPPSDPLWKGADSVIFVRTAMDRVQSMGYRVVNADTTLICAEPKIGPHVQKIQASVAKLLGVEASAVGIKAKTPEGLGTESAAQAHAVVLLDKATGQADRLMEIAEDLPQPIVDSVVEDMLERSGPATSKKR